LASGVSFNVSQYIGQQAQIEIVDQNSGGFGHINADEFLAADSPAHPTSTETTVDLLVGDRKIVAAPEPPEVTPWSFGVLLGSLLVDFLRVRSLRKSARQYASHALASDAEHFANDMVGVLAVMVGLAVVALAKVLPIPEWLVGRADAIARLAVAAIALRSVWRLGSEAVRALMDDVSPTLTGRLKDRVEGVEGVVKGSARVRAHFVGSRPYVEVALALRGAVRSNPRTRSAKASNERLLPNWMAQMRLSTLNRSRSPAKALPLWCVPRRSTRPPRAQPACLQNRVAPDCL
jgi:hypothetical protein